MRERERSSELSFEFLFVLDCDQLKVSLCIWYITFLYAKNIGSGSICLCCCNWIKFVSNFGFFFFFFFVQRISVNFVGFWAQSFELFYVFVFGLVLIY